MIFDNNVLQTDGLLSIMKGGLRKFPDIESNRNYREKKTLSLTQTHNLICSVWRIELSSDFKICLL